MQENTIHSFYLAYAAKSLFPGTSLRKAGRFGDLFFYDFEFPFEFNQDLLIMIEEKYKGLVKQELRQKIYSMMPLVAFEFLKSKGHKKLADAVKEEEDLVNIIEIDQFYDFSLAGLEDEFPSKAIRLAYFEDYRDLTGKLVTRIYGISASNGQELKKEYKKVVNFFKAKIMQDLMAKGFIGAHHDQFYLKPKALKVKEEIIQSFHPLFQKLNLEVIEPLEELPFEAEDHSFVLLSAPVLEENRESPQFERCLKEGEGPLFCFQAYLNEQEILHIVEVFIEFCKKRQLVPFLSVYYGSQFNQLVKDLESVTEFNKDNLKTRGSLDLLIQINNTIGLSYPILRLSASYKGGVILVRGEGFSQLIGLLAHLFAPVRE